MFKEFVNAYGMELISAVFMAVASYIGARIKATYEKYCNTKEKQDIVKHSVNYVEQIYKDIHGEDKLNKCYEAASELLLQKGMDFTGLELRVLIESSVNAMNKAIKGDE